jgi:hypothetical protein
MIFKKSFIKYALEKCSWKNIACICVGLSMVTSAYAQVISLPATVTPTVTPNGDGQLSLVQNGARSAQAIYGSIVPSTWNFWDANRSVIDAEGGNYQQQTAYGAYIFNNTTQGTAPTQRNSVGFSVTAVNAVAGSATWGINPAIDDSIDNTIANSFASTEIGA